MNKVVIFCFIVFSSCCSLKKPHYSEYVDNLLFKKKEQSEKMVTITSDSDIRFLMANLPPYIRSMTYTFSLGIHENPKLRKFLVSFHFPEEIMLCIFTKLARDPDKHVRCEIAKNSHTPKSILEYLRNDKDPLVLAAHPYTPADLLLKLSKSSDKQVLLELAENKHTPQTALSAIYQKRNNEISIALVKHPNVSPTILKYFIDESDESIQRLVIQNPSLPTELLLKFLNNNNNKEYFTWYAVLNPSFPKNMLEELLKDSSNSIRDAIPFNPKVSESILKKLSTDELYRVRRAVATNEKTPKNILRVLANDKDTSVKEAVSSNPNTPIDVIEKLSGEVTLKMVLDFNLSKDKVKILTKKVLSEDSKREKRIIVYHPNIPSEFLKLLSNDSDLDVRTAAKLRLHLRRLYDIE